MSIRIDKDDYDEDFAPTNDEGDDYAFVMIGPDALVFADGYGDLAAALFDAEEDGTTYDDLTVDEKLEKRHDLAVAIATQIQVAAVNVLADDPDTDFAVSDLDEQELNLVLNSKDAPHEYDREVWDGPATKDVTLPLFLVSTMYAPFTEVARPKGEDVAVIDPTSEEGLVRSLANIGVIELRTI